MNEVEVSKNFPSQIMYLVFEQEGLNAARSLPSKKKRKQAHQFILGLSYQEEIFLQPGAQLAGQMLQALDGTSQYIIAHCSAGSDYVEIIQLSDGTWQELSAKELAAVFKFIETKKIKISLVACEAAAGKNDDLSTCFAFKFAQALAERGIQADILARKKIARVNLNGSKSVRSEKEFRHKVSGSKLLFTTTTEETIVISDAYTKQWLYTYDKTGNLIDFFKISPQRGFASLKKAMYHHWPIYPTLEEKILKVLERKSSIFERYKVSALSEAQRKIHKALSENDGKALWEVLENNKDFEHSLVKKNTGVTGFFGYDCGTVRVWNQFREDFKRSFPEVYDWMKSGFSAPQSSLKLAHSS